MNAARIAALLEPFLESSLDPSLDRSLTASQLDQISMYIDLLQRWNARINLTAIRQEEEIVTRHFGESFFLARHLFPDTRSSSSCHPERSEDVRKAHVSAESRDLYPGNTLSSPRVLDIGSGAGFPALPLKIWVPHLHLTLIESNHKKAAFLREVARKLILTDINVITDRAETVSARPDHPRTEVVTLRAVEHFEAILLQAQTFLALHGTLALLIGASQLPHLQTVKTMKWNPAIPVPQSKERVLSIGVHR
jgi:16S rRNA (guanine527-N7)-methyltransferase